MKKILTKEEVEGFAQEVATRLETSKVLCLRGDLGAGKTFLSSKIIQNLMQDKTLNITSPTFNILNVYKTKTGKSIYHFDFYRIKNFGDLEDIGFFESLENGICIIEWWDVFEENIKKFLISPIFIDILYLEGNKREFNYYG
jgi:tRNA threonylcarbamoyl adenosine modification protein YjeE